MQSYRLSFVVFSIVIPCMAQASELICPDGSPTMADLGDGVIMRTCLWEKTPGVAIRVGPIELIKNGILILKTQTNADGKLHGSYASWHDNGKIMEKGNYSEGLKVGEWHVVDQNGVTTTLFYRKGILVEP